MYKGLDVSGMVVLVTGGTSGIGRAIALGFKAGRRESGGRFDESRQSRRDRQGTWQRPSRRADGRVERSERAERRLPRRKRSSAGSMRSINSAGVIAKKPSLEVTTEEFERIVRINLTGSFIVAREAAKVMKDQSPDATRRARQHHVHRVDQQLHQPERSARLRQLQERRAGPDPRPRQRMGQATASASTASRPAFSRPISIARSSKAPSAANGSTGHTPMNRFGEAEELVGAAIYLASPAASFTTGHTIIVDGGFLAKGV